MASVSTLVIPVKLTAALTLAEYQLHASRTLPFPGEQKFFGPKSPNPDGFPQHERNVDLLHGLLGLAGEVGELIDPVKKAMFYGKPLDVENIREEIGDLLWYIAGPLCRALQADLAEIAAGNVVKLRARYEKGYSDTAAIERADKLPLANTEEHTGKDEPTRPGYRWRWELSLEERAAAYKAMGSGTCDNGFFYDEDARAWVPVEALWEPVTEAAHAEQLDRELETATAPALALVEHLLRMGGSVGKIPVTHAGESFMVTVSRCPSHEPFGG